MLSIRPSNRSTTGTQAAPSAGSGRAVGALLAIGILSIAVLRVSAAPAEKPLSVYSTAANYSVPIVQRQGHDYIGLLEVLDPLGTVSAKAEPSRWRIHYNNILGDFTVGRTHARVQGPDADLSAKFLLENGPGLAPPPPLPPLHPPFRDGPTLLHK